MAVIGMDLGGTKLSAAIFTEDGRVISENLVPLQGRQGIEVGNLITTEAWKMLSSYPGTHGRISGLGICVPGIYNAATGEVWAPNIPGWENFPLKKKLATAFKNEKVSISIDSDRTCSILGETWKGRAINCKNAIFLAVGTGIGAGIMCDGKIIRGDGGIAGAVGWMALSPGFEDKYSNCGYFEYHASGEGILKTANEYLFENRSGQLMADDSTSPKGFKTTREVFDAYDEGHPAAKRALDLAVVCWGMASANLVSIFNPEIIVFGGGMFGPASRFLDRIREEASRWAQPLGMDRVRFATSSLEGSAGLAGAGKLALMTTENSQPNS
jgi:glucokinase